MHGIQTSGNCIRNITSDAFAGIAPDEAIDPRPYCEIIRQWSTLHPEFAFLPRKFKIAISGATEDRAATAWHDVGLRLLRNADGDVGFQVSVGGGMGRTPVIASVLREFLPAHHIMNYLEAVVRVYNRWGRRDNIYKARIKITVHENGIETIRDLVEARFEALRTAFNGADQALLAQIEPQFAAPDFVAKPQQAFDTAYLADPIFRAWADTNLATHKRDDHAIVSISLKAHGATPG